MRLDLDNGTLPAGHSAAECGTSAATPDVTSVAAYFSLVRTTHT